MSEANTLGIKWEDLPAMLSPLDLCQLLKIKSRKTISRLWREGQLPQPVIRTGKCVRWRTEDVKQHFDRRQRLPA